jgi:hypothetical protein
MGAGLLALALSATVSLGAEPSGTTGPLPQGLGDPGELKTVRIEPSLEDKGLTIRGRDARQQLFVTGEYSTGQLRDQTNNVKFTADPAGIINVDETGLVTPVADGEATVIAKTPNWTDPQTDS